jgi:hypothetical protein
VLHQQRPDLLLKKHHTRLFRASRKANAQSEQNSASKYQHQFSSKGQSQSILDNKDHRPAKQLSFITTPRGFVAHPLY